MTLLKLRAKVIIEENGKRETVSKLEAAISQLVSRATLGDPQAIRYCVNSSNRLKRGPSSSPWRSSQGVPLKKGQIIERKEHPIPGED